MLLMNSSIPQLNPEQQNAAKAPISPLLIVAGAGTGKTRTLTSRIVHFMETGIAPGKICAITFTNKASQEMKERVAAMTGESNPPYIATFHSMGARLLRRECRVFGRDPNFTIFDDHDSFDLVKKAVKAVMAPKHAEETDAEKKKRKEAPAFFAKKISEIKNLDPDKIGKVEIATHVTDRKAEEVKRVFALYENALRANNAFDFDDLIQKPVEMFKTYPDILQKYQTMFDAVLVDEYQDINPKQYELVKLLASGHHNLTVVGDDEQTIYTWRYADIKIFLDFDKEWPDAKIHFLEENYRSTGNIIRGATTVVQNNRFRTPKKLWTKANDGDRITVYEAWGENDEAAWIGMEIKRREAEAGDMGILYRTNAQSRAIEQALIRENIPYKIFGGLKFYERREVKDAVAALRYAANDKDTLSRERLEKVSKRKFVDFRDAVANIVKPKPTDVIKAFITAYNYFEYLADNFVNADERQENLAELIAFASGFASLPELLERLSLLQATDDANAEKARKAPTSVKKPVHLSTVHLAKGLEFDTVFIAGAAEGLLPHVRSIDNEAALEEERRLMYVAMTRARKKLHISFFGLPSRFVSEIPEECVELVTSGGGDDSSYRKERYQESDDDYTIENVVDW
jgi:DNA helicase-2/ATP-dependent DNA helicase PcrA